MRDFDYQQLVIGYHGCDASVRDEVIQRGMKLRVSRNDYDWLGHGVYFWEQGPDRALKWAHELTERGQIEEPAVIGAVLHLGRCFDLLDSFYTDTLADTFSEFCESVNDSGRSLPKNEQLSPNDPDRVLRKLDCCVVNWAIGQLDSMEPRKRFQTVRGVFQEGNPVYPTSGIRKLSHIQIAVRDPDCILGYFLPSSHHGRL